MYLTIILVLYYTFLKPIVLNHIFHIRLLLALLLNLSDNYTICWNNNVRQGTVNLLLFRDYYKGLNKQRK